MRIEVREGCLVRRFGRARAPVVLCVHGFADDGSVFAPLAGEDAPLSFAAVDLPGAGASPPLDSPSIPALADVLVSIARSLAAGPVTLLAHSMGAVVAVEAAATAPELFAALVSLEGNMTAADAYLSRRALRHDDPAGFYAAFCDAVFRKASEDPSRRRAAAAVASTDALTLWSIGRDIASAPGARLGEAYAALALPTLYAFDRASTPAETVAFLAQKGLRTHELAGTGHFPTMTAPAQVVALASGVLRRPSDGGAG